MINGRHAFKTVYKHYGVRLVDNRLCQTKRYVICMLTHVILVLYVVVYMCYPPKLHQVDVSKRVHK